jgi:hypothetical protein
MSEIAPAAPSLSYVAHDETLTGEGTIASLLSVAEPGITAVAHDATMTGDGTTATPLSVVASDAPPAGGTTMTAVSAAGDYVVTIEYNDTPEPAGLLAATLSDNPVKAWLIDPAGVVPPIPQILGGMPAGAPPDTAPVLSPRWVELHQHTVFVPNIWRGSIQDFFTWLATNNGVSRQLYANFIHSDLHNGFRAWAERFPALALTEPPF